MLNQTKYCNKCGELKDIDQFYKHKQTLDGKYGSCKTCVKIRQPKTVYNKHNHRLYKYNVTEEMYDKMFMDQKGMCASCNNHPCKRGLCIDHDHATGKVRGLLCNSCNLALGLLNDSMYKIIALGKYRLKH